MSAKCFSPPPVSPCRVEKDHLLLFQECAEKDDGGERARAAEVQGPRLDRADRGRGKTVSAGYRVTKHLVDYLLSTLL